MRGVPDRLMGRREHRGRSSAGQAPRVSGRAYYEWIPARQTLYDHNVMLRLLSAYLIDKQG